jgi:hypothetical protein
MTLTSALGYDLVSRWLWSARSLESQVPPSAVVPVVSPPESGTVEDLPRRSGLQREQQKNGDYGRAGTIFGKLPRRLASPPPACFHRQDAVAAVRFGG